MKISSGRTLTSLICLLFVGVFAGMGYAQDITVVALTSDTMIMQTGQMYPVEIGLIDSPEVWVVDVSIEYDSDMVYVMGTVAGSPVIQGDFFTPRKDSIVVRNFVEGLDTLEYTLSMLGQAQPPSGSGEIGTFMVYPLRSGTTRITINSAQITAIERGDANDVETSDIEFAVAQLDLTFTGDEVDPPDETPATMTPTPTRAVFQGENADSEPTLVSVTLPPSATQIVERGEADTTQSMNMVLPIALILIVIGVVGILLLALISKRKKR